MFSFNSVGTFAQQNAAATTTAALVVAFFLVGLALDPFRCDVLANSDQDCCFNITKANFARPRPVVFQMDRHCSQVLLDQGPKGHLRARSTRAIRYENKTYRLATRSAFSGGVLIRNTGRIVRISPDEVSVCDVSAVKTVYSVKETFRKTPWYLDFTAGVENIFSTNDIDFHRKSRRLLANPMADSAIHELAPRVGGHVDFAIQQMKAENETRKIVDVWKWWLFMTTDIIVEFTFGESFHILQRGEVRHTLHPGTARQTKKKGRN